MRPIFCLFTVLVLLLINSSKGFSQQLKLGKNPSAVLKSAVLELESSNQGLLFPRLTDTAGINLFSPPDGMVIYLTPAKQLFVRANNRWQVLTSGTIDTTNIANFHTKVRSLTTATTPITYTNGVIAIPQASSTSAGYLSTADWNTFNNKLSANNVWTRAGNAGTNSATDFIGTTDAQDLVFRTDNIERWRIQNTSGDIKIGDATSGTFKATKELVMREDGDTYGSSILRLRNRNAENGAIFETTTTDPGATLVDFIFKTSVNQRNIRYESRSSYSLVGVPAFHIAGSNPDVPTLAVGDNYAAVKNYLKVGAYTTPAEVLDVSGNVKLSGALMPGGSAGTSGQVLQSNGAGNSPTWVNSPAVTSDDYVYSYATATKTFSTAGTFADITINGANGPLSGWTHSTSSNTQNFTCNQTGVYQVTYSGQVSNTSSTVRELAIRAVLDGTEIAGSANSIECSSNANTALSNTFLVSITSGQVLKLQMTGSNTNIQLTAGGYGSTKPSISITIIRIK
jgi:hypothetical protein